jgi:hypothetical protein
MSQYMQRHSNRLLLLFVFLAFGALIAVSQPKLVIVGGLNFDYGTVYSNQLLKKQITLKNEGTDTLIVSDVSSSCGCTVALISPEGTHIPPDSTSWISVSFDPSRFSGPVTKGISFDSNDPKHAHSHIEFTVNVSKAIEISNDVLTFPNVLVDSLYEDQYTVKNVTNKPMKILSIVSTTFVATAEIDKKVIEPNDYATVKCRVRPTSKGVFKGNINIDTNCPDMPHISTRIFGLAKAKAQ